MVLYTMHFFPQVPRHTQRRTISKQRHHKEAIPSWIETLSKCQSHGVPRLNSMYPTLATAALHRIHRNEMITPPTVLELTHKCSEHFRLYPQAL